MPWLACGRQVAGDLVIGIEAVNRHLLLDRYRRVFPGSGYETRSPGRSSGDGISPGTGVSGASRSSSLGSALSKPRV